MWRVYNRSLIERQQVIIGYQQSIRQYVVSLSEYQSELRQRKVAVGEAQLMDVGAALRGGWVLSTPEHEGNNPEVEVPEEAPAKAEADVVRSGDQKKGKAPGQGGMITWAELLARPTSEAFGDMVRKFKSTPDVLRIQGTGGKLLNRTQVTNFVRLLLYCSKSKKQTEKKINNQTKIVLLITT
jgi:hypothetical protein